MGSVLHNAVSTTTVKSSKTISRPVFKAAEVLISYVVRLHDTTFSCFICLQVIFLSTTMVKTETCHDSGGN